MAQESQQDRAEQYVRERFDWLNSRFEEFYNQYDSAVCVFEVDAQEKRLVDGLHRRENSEHKVWGSLFLRLTTPFSVREVYFEQVHAELEAISNAADAEVFEPEAMGRDFRLPKRWSSAQEFVDSLKDFAQDFAMLPDELVLFLDPRQVADDVAWCMFCAEVMEALNGSVKLMLCNHRGHRPLDGFIQSHDEALFLIDVECDFAGFVLDGPSGEAAPEGADPAHRFRDLEGQMRVHAQKGRRQEAIRSGEDALAVTQSNSGWEAMEISLELEMGFMHVEWGERQAAEMRLDRAVHKAERLLKEMPEVGVVSLWQACQTRAAAAIHWGEFDRALADYGAASDALEGKEQMVLQRMELLRMVGECEARLGRDRLAMEAWQEAMTCAEQCDPQALPYSSVALIGVSLQDLAAAKGDEGWVEKVEAFMVERLGPNWRNRANPDGR